LFAEAAAHVLVVCSVTRFSAHVQALWDEQLLDAHFTLSMYKHLLNLPIDYKDVEAVDPDYYRNLCWMLTNSIDNVVGFRVNSKCVPDALADPDAKLFRANMFTCDLRTRASPV
jgi:hypothetical protein